MRPCHPISHLPACSSLTSSQSYTKWPLRISAHPQIRVDCRIRSHTRSYCYVSRSGPPSDESFHIRMVQRQACQLCSSVAGWFVMGWVLGVVVGRCREESCREQGSASFFRLSGSHTPSSYGYPCPCSHIQTHGPWIVSLVCCIASHAPHAHPPPLYAPMVEGDGHLAPSNAATQFNIKRRPSLLCLHYFWPGRTWYNLH